MKKRRRFKQTKRNAGGNTRIVITRPDGSQIVMPAHGRGHPERMPSPPLAGFLERDRTK